MIISEHWLREWISPDLDTAALVETLTMAGLEVDSVTRAGESLPGVVVGRIVAQRPHPEADTLSLCEVDVGEGPPLKVVCGAANARVGLLAPLARVGAELPNGTRIEPATIRKRSSQGMLCSAAELGLEDHSEGLMELDESTPLGAAVDRHLLLDDAVIDIDLTPNRGDCLSILGIARELSVLTGAPLKWGSVPGCEPERDGTFDIDIVDRQACPRYVGRVVCDLSRDAVTPVRMRERLRRCGVRPISPVVDVTNYVMLELGQPMHAFDLRRLENRVVVRPAKARESMEMLDGSAVQLSDDTLVIADDRGAVAMAGIMGGARSGIAGDTTDVLLESAHFTPLAVAGKARRYGMHTESSHRFERGVDPQMPPVAAHYATALLKRIAGGRAGPLIDRPARSKSPRRTPIKLSRPRVDRLLGVSIAKRDIDSVLRRISKSVAHRGDRWSVTPPSFRFDLQNECDLIEEIARVRGYDKIPANAPVVRAGAGLGPEARIGAGRLKETLMDRDYREVVSYSFVDPTVQGYFAGSEAALKLSNPLASNLSQMRVSLLPGLVQILRSNLNRQHRRVRIFEVGHTFHHVGNGLREVNRIAAAVSGSARQKQWGDEARDVDFFDIKGDIETLLCLGGAAQDFVFKAAQLPARHPGQCAVIERNGTPVGSCGRLHPAVQRELDIDQAVFVFELEVDALLHGQLPEYRSISRFPAIRRDLSILVDEKILAHEILDAIREAAGEHLTELTLFDVFTPEGIDKGRKSLAFTLTLQASSRTLRDEEVDALLGDTIGALQRRFGAELRS